MFQLDRRMVGGLILGAVILTCPSFQAKAAGRGEAAPFTRACGEAVILARVIRKAAVDCTRRGSCALDLDALVPEGARVQAGDFSPGATASCLIAIPPALFKDARELSPQRASTLPDEFDAVIARGCPLECLARGRWETPMHVPMPAMPVHRPIPSLERLRAAIGLVREGLDWVEPARGRSGTMLAFVSYQPSMDMTPSLNPSLTPGAPSPRPAPEAPVARAAPPVSRAEPAVPVPARGRRFAGSPSNSDDGGLTPCQDLRDKARRLRTAAAQCDSDVSNGAPSCRVTVGYESPRIPKSFSARAAEGYAERFEAVAAGGSEQACADFGGEGSIPFSTSVARQRASLSYDMTRRRADEHYEKLCAVGDHYACNARQIEELCFDDSPKNNCVRDCLVTQDDVCLAGPEHKRARCRSKSHVQCYASCRKVLPTPVEASCFTQFPGWETFK